MFRTTKRADIHAQEAWSCSWSDESVIVSGSLDETARCFDPDDDLTKPKFTLGSHGMAVIGVSTAGSVCATSCFDGNIRIFDLTSGALMSKLKVGPGQLWKVALHPAGHSVATTSHSGVVTVFDIKTKEKTQTFECKDNSFPMSVVYSPNGKHLAVGMGSGSIHIFDTGTGQSLHGAITGHVKPVRALAFNNNSDTLVTGADDMYINIIDVQGGERLGSLAAHTQWVLDLCFHPDGVHFASSGADGRVRLWDLASQECLHTFDSHKGQAWALDFAPDGKQLCSVGADRALQLYDTVFDQ